MQLRHNGTDRSVLALALALSLAPVACGEDSKPPAGVATPTAGQGGNGASGGRGGSGGKGGKGATGGSSGAQSSAGEGGEGGEPGSGGDAGAATGGSGGSGGSAGVVGVGGEGGTPMVPELDCPPEPTPGPPPAFTPVCDISRLWGDGERVPIPISGTDALMSVTPDERTIVWLAEINFFTTAYWIAERASSAVDFETPVEITDPVLMGASQVTLSPDGLRLVAVVSGRFLEATRVQRSDPFAAPDEGAFSLLDADAQAEGTFLSNPVIAPDDLTLYYSLTGASDDTLYVSSRTGSGPWPVGRSLGECEFRAHGGAGRFPTGVSSDGLTLFYFDNPRTMLRAATRPALDFPFLEFADLPGRYAGQPNTACDKLYYSGAGEFPSEVLVAEPE